MPVDPGLVRQMTAPFVQMLDDVRNRGLSGSDVDTMAAALAQMEALAASAPDAGSYGQALATSGLYQRFSDAYQQVISAAYARPQGGVLPGDDQLLAQTLAAYRSSLDALRGSPDEQRLTAATREVLALGESGVSYPVFLRLMTERGLDWAMGGAVVTRDPMVAAVEQDRAAHDPAREALHQEVLDAYDDLVSRSPFGVVDPFELELVRTRVEWAHAPEIASRDALIPRWVALLGLAVDWLDAHCSFAPTDDRFVGNNRRETQENIERARECNPGFLAVREALVTDTWGMRFDDIFGHETFAAAVANRMVGETDARIELARATRPYCVPGAVAPPELVARSEQLHGSGGSWKFDEAGTAAAKPSRLRALRRR